MERANELYENWQFDNEDDKLGRVVKMSDILIYCRENDIDFEQLEKNFLKKFA